MEIVESSFEIGIDEFLDRRLFCFLAGLSTRDEPRVSPLWFLWEDGSLWIIADTEKTYPDRVEYSERAAVAVVDFDPTTGLVQHVGFRGEASLEAFDPDRAQRLLEKYLGEPDRWDESRFGDPHEYGDQFKLIRFTPETAVARDVSYDSGLESGD